MDNRPGGRKTNVTGQGKDIKRRGEGLGTGPVGRRDGYSGRSGSSSGGGTRALPKIGGIGAVILVVVLLLFGNKLGLNNLFGGGSGVGQLASLVLPSSVSSLSDLTGSLASGTSDGWKVQPDNGQLDRSVAAGARDKRTVLKGDGTDRTTMMVYMCGTDLESKHGMASADLAEMAAATLSDKLDIIVMTGGCKQWKTSQISNKYNQVYKIVKGGIQPLEDNFGTGAMTDSATLTKFIKYCTENYKANRNILVLWDHGGGSVSGFGYDEKSTKSGSMTLSGIANALKNAGSTFDIIGFDACLMGTLENALTLDDYADYLIASEETEPGAGWYYTDWVSKLAKNPAISSLDLGKKIIDDFTSYCSEKLPGQKTTLSLTDLAELSATIPAKFKAFASDTANMISGDGFKKVSEARAASRSFAVSSKSDQVDLSHLAYNIGTDVANELAAAVRGAVKYNKTSKEITNAYGLAIYFPYEKTGKVDSAVKVYEEIGLDEEYSKAVKSFASVEVAGQAAASGGTASQSPFGMLGQILGQSQQSSSPSATDISDILGSLTGGSGAGSLLSSLTGGASSFFGIDSDKTARYVSENLLDQSALIWVKSGDGYVMKLDKDQWDLVSSLKLNLFYDDRGGYIDMGLDCLYEFNSNGELVGKFGGTWLAIDAQPVAYYCEDITENNGAISVTGRVPILLNGDRAELVISIDGKTGEARLAGVRPVYVKGETDTAPKAIEALKDGDKIDFVCDYYTYDGKYEDSYMLGDQLVYSESKGLQISDVYVNTKNCVASYLFTDIYDREYWTAPIPD